MGEGGYVDSVKLADARYVHFVRSTVAHGVITSIDLDEARSAPGVEAIWTADDLGFGPVHAPDFFPSIDTRFYRWPLAKDRVRFVGEPIAAILAETKYQAADAAELVYVDIDPLPV
ncbi:MAG: xanthine dehydrogenase family protein molybdopterin-binding subunit, partial [Acidimicrobiales bacterium]|nr:xanthine dehydrogenase family protein molybdopterin-binding subunit [Acidimicrobiales bacterium]